MESETWKQATLALQCVELGMFNVCRTCIPNNGFSFSSVQKAIMLSQCCSIKFSQPSQVTTYMKVIDTYIY